MYTNRSTSSGRGRWLIGLLIVIGAVVIFVGYQAVHSPLSPATALPTASLPTSTVAALAPTKAPTVYRLISDKAKISAVITELYYSTDADNWDLSHLGDSAGHLEGTPEMGRGGNFVLAGHVELKDGSQGPFVDLHLLTTGDRLTVIGDTQPVPTVRAYQVTDVGKVAPNDFEVMRNHGYEELTLITCDDYNLKTQTYDSRIIVHARPVKAPTPKATGTPLITPKPFAPPTGLPPKKS